MLVVKGGLLVCPDSLAVHGAIPLHLCRLAHTQINNVPIAWPLGYMTEKTLNIFTNDTPYGYDRYFSLIDLLLSIVLLSLVAIILTLLFIATVRVCLLMKPRTHEGYARL